MHQDSTVKTYPRLIFMLTENLNRVFTTPPPWRTGFLKQIVNLPLDWNSPDQRFVIIDSFTGTVYGPFMQFGALRYSAEGEQFVRKDPGCRSTYNVQCRWLMDFIPGGEFPVTRGISWQQAAKILGLDNEWIKYRDTLIDDESFQELCLKLLSLNCDDEDMPEKWDDSGAEEIEFIDDEDYSYVGFVRSMVDDDPDLIDAYIESDDRGFD